VKCSDDAKDNDYLKKEKDLPPPHPHPPKKFLNKQYSNIELG
jgi:hypothetical protein